MFEWVINTINSLGYAGIAFLMFLENVFPPLPSELIMPLAGFSVRQEKLNLVGVILAGTVGSVAGAYALYLLGEKMGEERLRNWADKHGRWFGLTGDDITKSKEWFDRHGNAAVFFGHLVPGVRSFISIPAGVDKMNVWQFLAYTTAGSALWAGVLAYIGYLLGENYDKVEKYMEPATYVILGIIVIAFIVKVVKAHQQPQAQTNP